MLPQKLITNVFNMPIQNTRFWIAGSARSAISAAQLLHSAGAQIFLTDAQDITAKSKQLLNDLKIPFEENGHSLHKLATNCDCLILSPAILLNHPLAIEARKLMLPVVSEIEVGAWFLDPKHKIVAITGTNGKSTTTHYLAQLFAREGFGNIPCGNYGIPFTQAIVQNKQTSWFALELSSYQLETTYTLRPHVSILLNLQSDHLQRYQTLEEYLKAKWRIILLTRDDGLCIIDRPVAAMAAKMGLAFPKASLCLLDSENADFSESLDFKFEKLGAVSLPVASYGEMSQLSLEQFLAPLPCGRAQVRTAAKPGYEFQIRAATNEFSGEIAEPCLPGAHNRTNCLAATAAAAFLGMDPQTLVSQWELKSSQYAHLAHRLETVLPKNTNFIDTQGRQKTLHIINDSKATNIESTKVALNSFSGQVRLLLGGEPKGENFSLLCEPILNSVTRVYAFGRAAKQILDDCESIAGLFALSQNSLLQAAALALEEADNGDIILLSPACASFDEFKNFEHRGEIFKEWALTCRVSD